MSRGAITFPIYPNWIFTRFYKAGYRPRGQPHIKALDVLEYTMRFTIQLPRKHAGITPDIVRDVINAGQILHCREVRVRDNLKWIGITIILDCVGLMPLGR